MDQYILTVKENRKIAEKIYQMVLAADDFEQKGRKINESPEPGQFLYIRVTQAYEPLLRRPISIYDYDANKKQIKIIYRTQGEGTNLLSKKKPGDKLDVLGPLGNGFNYREVSAKERVVLLGGGIGIPPLYYLAKKLEEQKAEITVLLGFESVKNSFAVEQFTSLGNVEVRAASIDGTIGIKGTVLDLIKKEEEWEFFYSCGPRGMLRAVKDKWLESPIRGYVSLEERMACGVGACYGCIVKTTAAGSSEKEGYKKVCADGPVFPFREVII